MPVKYEGPTTEMEKTETSVFGIPVSRQDKLEDERIRREVQQKRLERTQRRQRRNRRRLLAAAWAAAAVALMVSYHFGLRALWYAAPKGDISNGGVDISHRYAADRSEGLGDPLCGESRFQRDGKPQLFQQRGRRGVFPFCCGFGGGGNPVPAAQRAVGGDQPA